MIDKKNKFYKLMSFSYLRRYFYYYHSTHEVLAILDVISTIIIGHYFYKLQQYARGFIFFFFVKGSAVPKGT